MDDFFELFRQDQMLFGGWLNHVHGWWTEFSDNHNVLFVKYEDSKKDVRSTIRKIADFLGHELTENQVGISTTAPL